MIDWIGESGDGLMKKQITAIAAGKWLLDVGSDLLSQLSVEEGPSRHLTLKSRVFHLSAKSADIGPFLDRYQLKTRPKRSLWLSFCPKRRPQNRIRKHYHLSSKYFWVPQYGWKYVAVTLQTCFLRCTKIGNMWPRDISSFKLIIIQTSIQSETFAKKEKSWHWHSPPCTSCVQLHKHSVEASHWHCAEVLQMTRVAQILEERGFWWFDLHQNCLLPPTVSSCPLPNHIYRFYRSNLAFTWYILCSSFLLDALTN